VRFEDLQPQPATAVIAQLVASSFKKETEETRGFQKDGYTHAPAIADLAGFIPLHKPEGYVGWNVPAGTRLNDVGSEAFQGALPANISFEGPTLALWSEGKTPYSVTLRRAPDYRYRLDYLTPISQNLENTPPPKIPLLLPGATPTERKQAAQAYKAAHSHYLLDNRTPGKEKIIGVNNFSEITFDWGQGDNKAVRHTLRWYWGTENKFTTYKVSLDLDPKNTKFPDIPDGSNP
jgi:hypothetical protein